VPFHLVDTKIRWNLEKKVSKGVEGGSIAS
jgi:hypothetical protein